MPTATELVIMAFAATNGLRVAAYLPQIVMLARDESGAAGVSCCTWLLFLVSNISTAAYAALVLDDLQLTAVFVANSLCSGAIMALAILGRRRGKLSASGRTVAARTS